MKATIAVLPGDGIGPDVTGEAVRALQAIATNCGHQFRFVPALIGGAAIDETGEPLPEETVDICRQADAVLLGAVGGPKWDNRRVLPEKGLLELRQKLDVFANVRPIRAIAALAHVSPLKQQRLEHIDIVIVRELTGGIFFGSKTRNKEEASDTSTYRRDEIERITRFAARLAEQRCGNLISVDKANILETSRLWRETVTRVIGEEFPTIALEHMLADFAAMRLIQKPSTFDVILTANMFGDILTGEACALAGSMGILPSAALSRDHGGIFEPIHGSAPDLIGTGNANPVAAILSAALLLRYALGLHEDADMLENAVGTTIEEGIVTPDIAVRGGRYATTREVGEAVVGYMPANEVWY